MTGQSCDWLIVRGQKLELLARPLKDSRKWRRRAANLPVSTLSSANRDGYVCTWEVRDGRLWLVEIMEISDPLSRKEPARLNEFLVRRGEAFPILADWVSEILYCPEGVSVAYAHAGFMRKSERDRIFEIKKGEVVAEVLRINPPPPVAYRISPDGSRKLLGRDPYLHDGFEDLTFAGFRFLLDPDTLWGEEEGFYAKIDDLFAPEETPTGAPFWAKQAEMYRERERKEHAERLEWELEKLKRVIEKAAKAA
jgi:hypothetical protein